MPGLFISYRRSDNPDAVGRIYDRLVAGFNKSAVFKDVDSIPLGQDFRAHLNDVVGGCNAVLAIIGPKWTDIRNEAGQRRLDDPDDFVRIELEAALARNVPVVPVLVGHAAMPAASQLPASLTSLAYRQAIEVRPDPDFHNDATRLLLALRLILDPDTPPEKLFPDQGRRTWSPWLIGLAAATSLAAIALAVPAMKHLNQSTPAEIRTEIVTPQTDRPLDFALSPDGQQIVFVAGEGQASQLWLRSLGIPEARPLPGTEGAMQPFWSPDGKSLAYFTAADLRRVDLNGSLPRRLAPTVGLIPGGGSWSRDGVIIFSSGTLGVLSRISAAGGEAVPVTRLESSQAGHGWPMFLPDGKRFLFQASGSPDQQGLYLGHLDGRSAMRISGSDRPSAMLPSGWVLVWRDGTLVAQQLDAERAQWMGEPVLLHASLGEASAGGVSASTTGLIAMRAQGSPERRMQWFDRSGTPLGTLGDMGDSPGNPRISPDGRRIALDRTLNGNADVWLLEGEHLSRLTIDQDIDARPLWTPDGKDVLFYSLRGGRMDLYRKAATGAGGETKLLEGAPEGDRVRVPSSISPDGRYLLYLAINESVPTANIHVVRLANGPSRPRPWLLTPFNEGLGSFSPDGRWVAYSSDETGRSEIYIRPFTPPDAQAVQAGESEARWLVSTTGGTFPQWRADGRELYFLDPEGGMMAAGITATPTGIRPGTPERLFATRIVGGGALGSQGRQYDVGPDGRFLINVEPESGNVVPPITLIQNWDPARD